MSTFDFACSVSGTPSRKPFAKSLVTFVFLPAQFRTLSCYETTGSLLPRKPVKSSSFSHRYRHFRRKRSRMPLHQLQLFFVKTLRSLNFEPEPHFQHENKFGSQPAQNKLFLPNVKLRVHVGLLQLKTNNKERRLAVRCYISHLFEQLRAVRFAISHGEDH